MVFFSGVFVFHVTSSQAESVILIKNEDHKYNIILKHRINSCFMISIYKICYN